MPVRTVPEHGVEAVRQSTGRIPCHRDETGMAEKYIVERLHDLISAGSVTETRTGHSCSCA
jgi:hypothetical protein